jgi:hypothetical protein
MFIYPGVESTVCETDDSDEIKLLPTICFLVEFFASLPSTLHTKIATNHPIRSVQLPAPIRCADASTCLVTRTHAAILQS